MPSMRALGIALTVASCFASSTLASIQDQNQSDEPRPNLHEALHEAEPAFEDGIFDSDETAAEAIISQDSPDIAAKVSSMVDTHVELRRQDGNSSAASATASASTLAATTTATSVATSSVVLSQTQPSTQTSQTQQTTSVNNPTSTQQPTTSQAPQPTTSQPQTTTSQQTSPQSPVQQSSSPQPAPSSSQQTSVVAPPSSQPSSSANSASAPPATSGQAPTSSGSASAPAPPSSGSATSPATSFSVASTGNVPVPFTTSNSQGSVITSASSVPVSQVTQGPVISGTAQYVVTTDQFGQTITLTGVNPGQVVTLVDGAGHTITTTYQPGGAPVRSVATQVTTLSNGDRSTLTSVAVVVPTVTNAAPQNVAEKTTGTGKNGQPALVTGNVAVQSRKMGREAIALVAGAAGVAALL